MDATAGLVLAATAEVFRVGVRERALFAALGVIHGAARHSSVERQAKVAARVLVGDRSAPLGDWAWTQAAGHDWLAVLAAGCALGRFDSRLWSSSITVPVASVVTTDDSVVPPERQRGLAAAVTAPVFATPADHHTIIDQPELVRPALLRACEAVTEPAIPLAA